MPGNGIPQRNTNVRSVHNLELTYTSKYLASVPSPISQHNTFTANWQMGYQNPIAEHNTDKTPKRSHDDITCKCAPAIYEPIVNRSQLGPQQALTSWIRTANDIHEMNSPFPSEQKLLPILKLISLGLYCTELFTVTVIFRNSKKNCYNCIGSNFVFIVECSRCGWKAVLFV